MIGRTTYVAALRSEGCRVLEHARWSNVDRPGPWEPRGVMVHHTGPPVDVETMLGILRRGRPDLPGPLCHAGGRPNGIIDLVGWFDANHAGAGDPRVLEAVILDDRPPPAPRPGADKVDGNMAFYGLELIHAGHPRAPFPDAQVEAAVRYCAALCRAHRWTANSVIYHKGWTTRKVDPTTSFPTITEFRRRVAERLRHRASWDPGDPQLPTMKELLTMKLTDKVTIPASYPSNRSNRLGLPPAPETVTVETLLRRMYDWAYRGAFDVPPEPDK